LKLCNNILIYNLSRKGTRSSYYRLVSNQRLTC